MGLSPTKPNINLSKRGGARVCDASTMEPNNIATITNIMEANTTITQYKWEQRYGGRFRYLTELSEY